MTSAAIITDSVYWIWFQLLFGIGTRRAHLLQEYFANPKEIFDGITAKTRVYSMLSEDELNASETAITRAAEIKRRTLAKGVDIITPENELYPELLRNIYSRPSVLYVKGDLSCLSKRLAIAMVGSRKHTDYGKEAAAWIAKGLAKGGAVVVSGLAHGIDTECHMAALKNGGKSIGILGCGIDVDYPKGNASVKRLMCENGAVVTEYPLGTRPVPANFPTRNRIVSGICHGVVVVEADLKSGSLITAQHALEQGREIFAVPGSIFSSREKGAHQLIRDGAKLTDSAQDIFDEYKYLGFWKNITEAYVPGSPAYSAKPPMPDNAEGNRAVKPISKQTGQKKRPLPENADLAVSGVYGAISADAISVEQIAEITDIEISSVLSALTELEIYGLIQGYPGRKFAIIPEGD